MSAAQWHLQSWQGFTQGPWLRDGLSNQHFTKTFDVKFISQQPQHYKFDCRVSLSDYGQFSLDW